MHPLILGLVFRAKYSVPVFLSIAIFFIREIFSFSMLFFPKKT